MAALDASSISVNLKDRYHPFPSNRCLTYKNKFIKIDFKFFNCDKFTRTYTNEEFIKATDGVYVWIYAGIDGSNLNFYFRQTVDLFEICTKHASLLTILNDHPGPVELHSAGELKKEKDGSIRMNLMSGSFMSGVSLTRLDDAAAELQKLISLPIEVDHDVKTTYITKDAVVHEYDDAFYRKLIQHGARIKVYTNIQDCSNDVDYKRQAVAMNEFEIAKRFKKPGDPEPVYVEPPQLYESIITTIEEFDAFISVNSASANSASAAESVGGFKTKRKIKNKKILSRKIKYKQKR
jgi:hypothetical protein